MKTIFYIIIVLTFLGCSRDVNPKAQKVIVKYDGELTEKDYNIFCNSDPSEIYKREFDRIENNIVICKDTVTPSGYRFKKALGDPLVIVARHQAYWEKRIRNEDLEEK